MIDNHGRTQARSRGGCIADLQAVTSWTLSIEDISDGRPNVPYFLTDAGTERRNIAQVADSNHNSCRPMKFAGEFVLCGRGSSVSAGPIRRSSAISLQGSLPSGRQDKRSKKNSTESEC